MIYTGIGSRQTPLSVLGVMRFTASLLAKAGWTLRSGHADGADLAFENACCDNGGKMEIFLPWMGFNGAPNSDPPYIVGSFDTRLRAIAQTYHPYWETCTEPVRRMHTRNVQQILGSDDSSPITNLVICWTKDGKASGGTGQALRVAKDHGIPIINLYNEKEAAPILQAYNKAKSQGINAFFASLHEPL